MTRKIGPNETLGVACLGITHPHTSGRVKAIQRRTDAKMLGAWDTSPLLTPFVDALGLEARSKEDILADENVHVVLVHSKSEKMADLTIEALEAGKAVLCEKPAGRSSADAKRIVDAVERTGGLVQVGYCWRFAPSVDAMQAALKSGRLGKVVQVRAHGGCSHDEAGTPHMTQPGDIGGAVFVIGCHLIDRILLHFGVPRSVNARITKFPNFHGDESREDAAGAVLNYEDKIVSVDFMSWDVLPWTDPEGWTEWQETSFPEIWATKKTEYSPDIAEIGNPVYFDRESKEFFDALRNGTPSVVPATQAYNISRVIEAMFASSKEAGAEVFIG